jgi:hypothetical protein
VSLGFVTPAWAGGPTPDAAPGAAAPAATPDSAVPAAPGAPSPSASPGAVARPAPDGFGSKAPTKTESETVPTSHPLHSTPYLGAFPYVFPVVGSVSYGDSYGAPRSDVPGKWHHGDDIFASPGAPVVAVAGGTVDKIGWNRIGGWRLWLHDAAGNAFYYAHLSAYATGVLHSSRVKAGQVLGFIGDTGDASTTPFHLHFEVHPAVYRYMGEDGAVDPTSYLYRWRHLEHVAIPRPALPALPGGAVGGQAEQAFEQLLALPSIRTALRRARAKARAAADAAARGPSTPAAQRPLLLGMSAPLRASARTGSPEPGASAPSAANGSPSNLEIAGLAVGALVGLIALVGLGTRVRPLRRLRTKS